MPNIFLLGDIGAGKTTSVRTLLPEYIDTFGESQRGAGQEVFLISLAPGADRALGSHLCQSSDAFGIHHTYLPPVAVSWDTVRKFSQVANTLSMDQLSSWNDPDRYKYTQLKELFSICEAFVCQGCGQEFGDISEFGPERTIVLDDHSNLCRIVWQSLIGSKPIQSRPEYYTAQGMVRTFCDLWFGATKCNAIQLCHIDREVDPLTSASLLTINTIGQRLTPHLVRMTDEVILAERTPKLEYLWRTVDDRFSGLKSRLGPRPELPPTFAPFFER